MKERYWIGVDLGGTNVRVGLLNDAGILLREQKKLTEVVKGPEHVIEKLKGMITEIKDEDEIKGIGIGMPGPLDPYQGIVQNPVNLPGWDNIPLGDMLTDYFKVPCFIENDANVAALAESLEGAGKDYPIVYYITVSTGVGGGLCINGEIISGATGNTGEIGNIIIKENGVRHSFLNPGSLEGMASGTGIMRMAEEKGLHIRQAHEVFSLAAEGNPDALEITEAALDALGRGMAAIAHVIDPHIFILGGGVAVSVPGFLEKVRAKFEQYIYEVMRGKIKIELAQLSDPGMIGAMYMVKKRAYGEIDM
ncbi:MAG: ROK family protein [Bacillota bacterium]